MHLETIIIRLWSAAAGELKRPGPGEGQVQTYGFFLELIVW